MPAALPGFNRKQADRFRNAFRRSCAVYGTTNADVGEALDGLLGRTEGSGPKTVANAMLRDRKLTHSLARRLVVALFLSKPARHSDPEIAAAMLGQLVGLLNELGALRLFRPPSLPVFVATEHADELAKQLAEAATRVHGVGTRRGPAVARALGEYIRARAAAMARAWCDAVQQPALLDAARLGLAEAERVTESLAKAIFRESYVYQGEGPGWGPEFEVLDRERPELMQGLAIPVCGGDS